MNLIEERKMNEKDIPRIIYNTFESLFEYISSNGCCVSHNHFLELVAESCDYKYTEQVDLDCIIDTICSSCDQIDRQGDVINLQSLNHLWEQSWPIDKKEIEKVLGFKLKEA